MRVYKMGPQDGAQHIEKDPSMIVEYWLNEDAQVGDVFEVTVMEMSEEKWEKLPEYDGP